MLIMLWGTLRGDSLRILNLCDFFIFQYPQIGRSDLQMEVWGLGWVKDAGKDNQVDPALGRLS